ncbi:AAA family ATPase [Pseudozobellia thermophila]|uniref:Predicted ATPase n=1 Tax=Pseudozobellia thermophila TaxID=192903 RepID=A0A1M6LHW3_9FLAO|nr:ATP-binding protein [Pseudozobellia thermophila]SHJ70763.1 Predicted ATPase [Pseudozobellia thermophila]
MITFASLSLLHLSIKKVVITGGPSTGKTSVIKHLEQRGYFCVHELIRSMTSAEKKGTSGISFETNPIVSVKDPKKFNQMLLDGRIDQYHINPVPGTDIVFYDRGIPDVHAYMDCFGQDYDSAFAQACYDYRYDAILLMPPWEEIYAVDNERFETYEESVRVFECLEKAYTRFGYTVTLVPKGSIEERSDFILERLKLV